MQDDLPLKSLSVDSLKPIKETITSQLLFKLTLFSTTLFVFLTLFLRFLLNLQTALLLRIYSIHFQYRLFDIHFSTEDGTKWPVARILLVFGLGYLVFSLAGIFLVAILSKIHNVSWKIRLFLTWMAFLLINTLPAGIIAGVLFFNCFGIAFHWLIGNIIIRSLIAASILVIMILLKPTWVFLFLKASPMRMFSRDDVHQKLYIQNAFFKSWLGGFLILLVFNRPLFDGFWPVFLLSLGFIAMPLFNQRYIHKKLHISRSPKKIISSHYSFLYILVILVLIWFVGTFRINV
jgi:hypothetical protein